MSGVSSVPIAMSAVGLASDPMAISAVVAVSVPMDMSAVIIAAMVLVEVSAVVAAVVCVPVLTGVAGTVSRFPKIRCVVSASKATERMRRGDPGGAIGFGVMERAIEFNTSPTAIASFWRKTNLAVYPKYVSKRDLSEPVIIRDEAVGAKTFGAIVAALFLYKFEAHETEARSPAWWYWWTVGGAGNTGSHCSL